jgi:hypothetical protein
MSSCNKSTHCAGCKWATWYSDRQKGECYIFGKNVAPLMAGCPIYRSNKDVPPTKKVMDDYLL